MGFIYGLVKRLIKASLYFLIFAAIVVLIPNLPPYTTFSSIPLEPTQPRTGPLAPNGALNNAEKLYVDKVLGPEAFQVYKGDLYTSLATGEIVKVSPGGHVTFVTKIGQPCTGLANEHICGRPLGFQIDENNNVMYVSDAYYGIWKVDLKNNKKQVLVPAGLPIDGREPKLYNSLALCRNGDIYWTDSTSDFQLKDGGFSVLSDPTGRLFHYNAAKNSSQVKIENVWFANGIVASPDNQFVVMSETSRYRLMKHYIDPKSLKFEKSEVFVAGLPGAPDNIRSLPDGSGILVSLYTSFDEQNPLLARSMAAAPLVRKFLARIQKLIEIPFEYLNSVYPHVILEDIVYSIGHFKSISGILPKITGLVQIDWNGNIVASYYNTDGTLDHISDAIVYNNRLYTGSPHGQNFIGSVAVPPLLKKAFESKPVPAPKQPAKPAEAPKPKAAIKPKVEEKKEAPKPTTQAKPAQQQAKSAEATKPPPAEKKPAPKPVEQPKPAQQKPTTPPPRTEPPKAQPKQETKPTPKPEIKTTPPPTPKSAPKATAPPAKPQPKPTPTPAKQTTAKPAEVKPEKVTKPKESQKPVKVVTKPSNKPEQIPIKEEIPSDTAKPTKEKLKVIKKDGPTEIPNPNL